MFFDFFKLCFTVVQFMDSFPTSKTLKGVFKNLNVIWSWPNVINEFSNKW